MMRRILAISAIILLCALAVLAGTTPAANCGTGTDVVLGIGKAWTNPGNIAVSGQVAFANGIGTEGNTDYLVATNFSFSVPGASTILGVQASFTRSGSSNIDISDNLIFLTKNGTVTVGNDHSNGASWPVTASQQNYGGIADLWGVALAPADVNANTFGLMISAQNNSATFLRRANVFAFVTMTITYSTPSTGYSPGFVGTMMRQGIITGVQKP
jgi:hypothetical protein